jgi:mono/diheme cytochrome c family protein
MSAPRRLLIGLAAVVFAAGWLVASVRATDPPVEGVEFFEKKVRPVLAEHCFQCHSATHKKKKGGLLLDSREPMVQGGESGPAIVPGDPDRSLLIKAIRYLDPDLKMPKPGKLADAHIDDLVTWVKMGAPWPEGKIAATIAVKPFDLAERAKHWSLQPIQMPIVPTVANPRWCRTPVDKFVLARLEAAGIKPALPTDKRTLLRRVTFDLTGLPPTPQEISDFLIDDSPTAFEKVVDRLLASPHYGERWARHWLDLVRYADTLGHEFDFELPDAYRYRDYVIRAFNDDLPFDQFAIEQIAGDLLESPRRHPTERFNESIIGTGFWRFCEAKHSPVDVRGDQADHIDNQIDVFGKAFLATTIACARCHDHKFDAVTTQDYYALSGYLQSGRPQRAFIDDPRPTRNQIAKLRALQDEIRGLLAIDTKAMPAVAAPVSGAAEVFVDFRKDDFKDWFVSGEAFGDRPSQPGAILVGEDAKRPIKWMVAPGIAHSGLVSGALRGVLRSPMFIIDKDALHVRAVGRQSKIRLILDGLQLIQEPIYGGLDINVNHGDALKWVTFNLSMWRGHRAYLEFVDESAGYIGVEQVVFSDGPPPAADGTGGMAGQPCTDDAAKPLRDILALYRAIERSIKPSRRAQALEEGTPIDEKVFIRGNHKNLGQVVPRRFLEVFQTRIPAAKAAPARLALAQKLVDPANPLTARVFVNRLWKHHFGEGIVRSVDDFGVQGTRPSHPGLLDWLAARFVQDGWSVKKMHRLLLLSSVYQMSSQANADSDRSDPDNALLHKMPLRRLDAECIRDSILAASGSLRDHLYGPSVMPNLTPFMEGRGRPRESGPLDGNGRRSIYLAVRRNFLSPLLVAFDFPTPFTTMGKRSVSNVPAQALALLNNPFVLDQANKWGSRVANDKTPPRERISRMVEAALGRPPVHRELDDWCAFIEEEGRTFGNVDDPRVWADAAHVLFNLKEFIYIH